MDFAKKISTGESKTGIQKLVNEVANYSKEIGGVRPPNEGQAAEYGELINRTNQLRGRPLFFNYLGAGLGNGPYVELLDGSVKIDLINGIGVHLLGHSHPKVIEASVIGAMQDVVNQGHLQMGQEYIDMGEKLINLAKGSRLQHCWLTTCGTMANENALKMARQKNSPAKYILAMENAFSGRSTMMAELTDNPNYKQGLPVYDEVLRVPFYDKFNPQKSRELALQKMKEHIDKYKGQIAAFCFEPILGEGGYRVAPREFFIPLLEECKKHNIAVWTDEVQTFMRTGQPFAFQTLGFAEYVDLCTVAKTAQIGATLYTEEYNPKPGLIAGTYSGSTVALSAGLAVMDEMMNGNYMGSGGRVEKIHKKFISELTKICEGSCKGNLEDPDGIGLMVAVTPFGGNKEKVLELIKNLFNNGLMCFGCGKDPFRIRFLVPAIISDKQIEESVKIIEETILKMK